MVTNNVGSAKGIVWRNGERLIRIVNKHEKGPRTEVRGPLTQNKQFAYFSKDLPSALRSWTASITRAFMLPMAAFK